MASRSNQSVENMEDIEGSASDYELELEGSDHGADLVAQFEEEPPCVAPGVPSIDCPSQILIEFARGPYDPNSSLKQFSMKITHSTSIGGGTRK